MKRFDEEALQEFYSVLSNDHGIAVQQFLQTERKLFGRDRSNADVAAYRLGKGAWKKLRDEVVPMATFLRSLEKAEFTRVRFPLNNQIPDSWLMSDDDEWHGVEITIERGKERHFLAKEANSEPVARGFIGLQDDVDTSDFKARMEKPRMMYTSEQALRATKEGLLRCFSNKGNWEKYGSTRYLLIESHLSTLPKERWKQILPALSQAASELPFKEVYVVSTLGDKPLNFQLKP